MAHKTDAVAQNSIWEEHVRKENRTLRLNEHFSIPNPSKSERLNNVTTHSVRNRWLQH
jgi:hypothetical protein